MFELYKINKSDYSDINTSYSEVEKSNYSLSIFEPSIIKFSLNENKKKKMLDLYFYLITLGGVKIYYIKYKDKIVHTSYCMNKSYKFPFMKKGDIHIGPCNTDQSHRGRGLYPYVLSKIIEQHKNKDIYLIIDSMNIASKKGASKVDLVL